MRKYGANRPCCISAARLGEQRMHKRIDTQRISRYSKRYIFTREAL